MTETPLVDMNRFGAQSNEIEANIKQRFEQVMESSYIFFAFVYAVFTAFALKLFYRKHQYTLSELYIVALWPTAHSVWFGVLLLATGLYSNDTAMMLYTAFFFLYTIFAFVGFFNDKIVWNSIKATLVNLLSFIIFVVVFSLLAGIFVGASIAHHENQSAEPAAVERPTDTD